MNGIINIDSYEEIQLLCGHVKLSVIFIKIKSLVSRTYHNSSLIMYKRIINFSQDDERLNYYPMRLEEKLYLLIYLRTNRKVKRTKQYQILYASIVSIIGTCCKL